MSGSAYPLDDQCGIYSLVIVILMVRVSTLAWEICPPVSPPNGDDTSGVAGGNEACACEAQHGLKLNGFGAAGLRRASGNIIQGVAGYR
jgi:hypothetical protein